MLDFIKDLTVKFLTGVVCKDPGPITNGSKSGGHLFGDTVTYVCSKGHIITEESSQLVCQANQTWQGVKPTCSSK